MISARKIERLERFWEAVARDVESQLRIDGHVIHYHALSRLEIRERVRAVIRCLENWLVEQDNEALASQFRTLAAQRAEQGVPLFELIYKMSIIKQKLERRVLESDPSFSAIEVYEEYEWMRTIERGFEIIVDALASSYENSATASSAASGS
jgi:hypothetical protein